MQIESRKLGGLLSLVTEPFHDSRGAFEAVWESVDLRKGGVDFTPVSACHSYNEKRGTLRGLHYQKGVFGQAKLVSCVNGGILDVVVDVRPESPTFLGWDSVELTAGSGRSLYIPPGFAHGFISLTDHATVAYLIEGAYKPAAAATVRWNDPSVGIRWPILDPILSERDRLAPDFVR
jgi:dTDP-4-dehydrorhamnose 3,5-epimerase